MQVVQLSEIVLMGDTLDSAVEDSNTANRVKYADGKEFDTSYLETVRKLLLTRLRSLLCSASPYAALVEDIEREYFKSTQSHAKRQALLQKQQLQLEQSYSSTQQPRQKDE